MKVFKIIAKIVLALAAIAGAIYLAATYGDRVVAWAKNLLNRGCCCCDCDCDCDCDCECDCDCCEVETPEVAAPADATDADFEG